jgi:hypothetical protein
MPTPTKRLWFRLDDVLPLAEHAMACRHHPPTGSQAGALSPDGPALIITHTPTSDLMTSNGFPRWYGPNGGAHAAHAQLWRQPATGRRGTPMRADRPTAHLPLHHTRDGEPPLIDMLRAGRHLDRHWVTIDSHPTGQLLSHTQVDVRDHRDELVPAHTRWTATTVTLPDTGFGPFQALVADGYTTAEGDLIARFDRRTAAEMAAYLDAVDRAATMPGEYPILRFDGDVLVLLEDDEDTNGRNVPIELDRYHPDAEGRYSVGAYLLPWHTAENTPRRTRRWRFPADLGLRRR